MRRVSASAGVSGLGVGLEGSASAVKPEADAASVWRGLGEKLVIFGIAGLSLFAAPKAKAQDAPDPRAKKAWETRLPSNFDEQAGGTPRKKTGELAGLMGLTKVVGFTAGEKATFQPVTLPDSLTAALADTLGTLPKEVIQEIANCYWAAALQAVLQSDPHFLDDRVTRRGVSPNGLPLYAVRLHTTPLLGGRERTVLVEASLPPRHLKSGTPNGLSDPRSLRAALYEKAFAQAMGGYSELAWGNAGKALRAMTGHDSRYTFLELSDPDRLFHKLERRLAKNRPMVLVAFDLRDYLVKEEVKLGLGDEVAAFQQKHGSLALYTGEGARPRPEGVSAQQMRRLIRFHERRTARDPEAYGIVDQHCYSVVSVRREEQAGQTVRLVELRDPRHPERTFTKTIEEVQKAFCFLATGRL